MGLQWQSGFPVTASGAFRGILNRSGAAGVHVRAVSPVHAKAVPKGAFCTRHRQFFVS